MSAILRAALRYALQRGAKGAGSWYVVAVVLGLLGALVRQTAPRATKR